jgi:hypothetical protein
MVLRVEGFSGNLEVRIFVSADNTVIDKRLS